MMYQKVGDGTNLVILLIGSLLEQAEDLIRLGLKPVEIIAGYEMARDRVLDQLLDQLVVDEIKELDDHQRVTRAIRASIMSKQYGNEDFLSKIIAEACISVMPKGTPFNVDNVRVCKILGAGIQQTQVIQGMVLKRNVSFIFLMMIWCDMFLNKKQVEGSVTRVDGAKVVVFTCPLDVATTETKGTVLIKTADELMNFSKGEENLLEAQIKAISDAGVRVIVSGGKFGDMALHYCNKYNLMAVRVLSKFDVRRVAKSVGATVLPRIEAPKPEEQGFCDSVYIDEVADTPVVILKQNSSQSKIATIVVRGSTENVMDDVERAVDDGINTFKALSRDGRLVAGAGAFEMEVAAAISSWSETIPGLEQYAVQKYSEALQSLPAAIATNAGIKSHELLTQLLAAHQAGDKNAAVDISTDTPKITDAVKNDILDLYLVKYWAIKYATSTATTILQVDQIYCSKLAGGPKPRDAGGDWDQD